MRPLPPLSALRSFEAVARLGSVTLAATELHVTHSAISQQIKQLEEMLGVVLLLREGRGLRLSEDGRLYALQIRLGLAELTEATRLVQARPREGELVIAVLPSFGANWLLPRLPRFHARFPSYRLSLRASLDIQDLRQGLVDVGVRMGQGNWEGLQQKKLFDDELVMVASPTFNHGRLPRTPTEVVAAPAVRTPESWLAWCQAAGVAEPAHAALWINDSNLVLEAAKLGQGVALERRSIVQASLDNGSLCQLTDITVPYAHPHWLVWPQRESAQIKRNDFIQWIEEEVALYFASLPSK
ncbi:LysR substrate-binding domain-containing protein [Paludibacterium yongneupense]|uniref:LysR substrate-binding domain-containing protein n=1 Tax=Paludibacterium yongneupense TaxID=400061 RepID=UPI000420671B|nr:LysR substrate-binding domain-containing protein [Paludibacterium yongneupense]